jgi:CRP/FNR family transcriptional regulator
MKSEEELIRLIKQKFPEINDPELLHDLAISAVEKTVKEGDILIDYGEEIKFVPLVLEGTIKVNRQSDEDHEIFLYYLMGGDTCATSFSCCMIRKRSEIIATAEEDSKLLMIPLVKADQWMSQYAAWRNFIFSMYDVRMFSMIDTIDRLAFSNLDEQLIDYLEKKSSVLDTPVIESTHQQIAYDLNVTREAVSRLLKKLENEGNVKLERNKIHLL